MCLCFYNAPHRYEFNWNFIENQYLWNKMSEMFTPTRKPLLLRCLCTSSLVMNWKVNWVFGRSLDLLINLKLPLKKSKILQTEIVDGPGLSVAVRLTIDIETGNRPRKKAPIVANAVQNERPQKLIKWTSLMHPSNTLDWKVGLSVIALHSLLHKCSGSTQITCHLIHSFITSDNRCSTRKWRHSVLTVWKPRKRWARNMRKR